jgi:hypothetical protein
MYPAACCRAKKVWEADREVAEERRSSQLVRDLDALTKRIKAMEAAKQADVDAAVAAACKGLQMKLDDVRSPLQ